LAVDPTGTDLKRLLAEDPGGPVVMLNLLRFAPDGGRKQYAAYLAHFRTSSAAYGARVLCLSEGSTSVVGERWDALLVVEYPSRQHFSDMLRDPAYRSGTHLRTGALTEAVLQATTPWDLA